MSDKSGGSFQDSLNDWLVSIIVAVALAFCIRTFIFEPYKVEGTSMYPTLFNQERLIVNKFGYFLDDPKRNEIVVFRYPKDESRDFIKRVIAVGGDTVEMRDGAVLINGKKIGVNTVSCVSIISLGLSLTPSLQWPKCQLSYDQALILAGEVQVACCSMPALPCSELPKVMVWMLASTRFSSFHSSLAW